MNAWLRSIYELSDRNRIAPLQGVRALAITLVFFVHYHTLFGGQLAPGTASAFISAFLGTAGHIGVDLFFVLSGALIYGGVRRAPIRYGTFMQRRLRRLYPAFAIVLTTYVALSFVFPSESKLPAAASSALWYVVANAALLPGVFHITPMITVAWSLSFEFLFYLTVPLLVRAAPPASRRSRVIFLIAMAAVALLWFARRPAAYVRIVMFVSGMLVHEALGSSWFRARLTKSGEAIVAAMVLASLPAAYLLTQISPTVEQYNWPASLTAILFVTYFWFLVYAASFSGWIARVCAATPARWLGNISYSFFLVHGLTLKAMSLAMSKAIPASWYGTTVYWLGIPAGFSAAIVVATCLFLVAEKPFLATRSTVVPLVKAA